MPDLNKEPKDLNLIRMGNDKRLQLIWGTYDWDEDAVQQYINTFNGIFDALTVGTFTDGTIRLFGLFEQWDTQTNDIIAQAWTAIPLDPLYVIPEEDLYKVIEEEIYFPPHDSERVMFG